MGLRRSRRRVLIDATRGSTGVSAGDLPLACAPASPRPVLVIHGDEDRIRPHSSGVALAELTGGQLVTIGGGGHGPQGRDPVLVNRLIEQFVDTVRPTPRPAAPPRTWVRAARRPKRALYLSSPIGLGHALRDAAIADELRKLHPDLQIDWLAQHPVTTVLEHAANTSTRRRRSLASESAHVEERRASTICTPSRRSGEMDEMLVNNFMVFDDVVARRALRPGDRRRGLGRRLLPPREPRAQALRVRLDDRLRRLAADARRRVRARRR